MTMTTRPMTGLAAAALVAALAAPGWAQDAFIQLEAKRSLDEGLDAAMEHETRVPDVSGFTAAGGWYVVAIGPLPEGSARAELDRLLAQGAVPADSFLTEGDLYRQRFWPAAAEPATAPEPATDPEDGEEVAARLPLDETPREARASEAALTREEREAIQTALEWAGYYDGAIDAAFGRGTRRAMEAWQRARGLEPTGVLTTAQRAALIGEYEAVFDGLGMARVEDAEAGISLDLPTAALRFEGRETPFSRYADPEGGPAEVVLVSRSGDPVTLRALFEVMQTLDVVPRSDRHVFEGDVFRLRGRDEERLVRGYARLRDGHIKGLLLAWPADDPETFNRLWTRMRRSFGVDPTAVLGPEHETPAPEQRLDRLAGLEIREPTLSRTGFFVDGGGAVMTTAELSSRTCRDILIDDAHPARVAWTDGRVALLRPEEPLAPPRVASFAAEPGRLGSEVAVAGFPFGGMLGRASLTQGRLEDLRGLGGDEDLHRYEIRVEEGDAGGPVLAPDGTVAGLLLPGDGGESGGRVLPPEVAFGVDAARLLAILEEVGVEPPEPAPGEGGAERLAREGAELAVLVTCHG